MCGNVVDCCVYFCIVEFEFMFFCCFLCCLVGILLVVLFVLGLVVVVGFCECLVVIGNLEYLFYLWCDL